MSTTAAGGYSSEEDSRNDLLHNPFGIVSSTNPAKRVKVDFAPAKKSQVDAAPHVLAEVRTYAVHHILLSNTLALSIHHADPSFSAGHYEPNLPNSPPFRYADAR